jgi:hypothetical protein
VSIDAESVLGGRARRAIPLIAAAVAVMIRLPAIPETPPP